MGELLFAAELGGPGRVMVDVLIGHEVNGYLNEVTLVGVWAEMSTTAVIVRDGRPAVETDVESRPGDHEPEDLIGFHFAGWFAVDQQCANAMWEWPIARAPHAEAECRSGRWNRYIRCHQLVGAADIEVVDEVAATDEEGVPARRVTVRDQHAVAIQKGAGNGQRPVSSTAVKAVIR